MSTTAASGAYGALSRVSNVVSSRVGASKPNSESSHLRRAPDDLRVGIDDDLVGIEAVARVRRVGPVHAVAVELARPHVGQVAVPDHVGLLGQRDRQRFDFGVGRIEQAELDSRRMLGEQREVDADAVPGRAQRIRRARPDAQIVLGHRRVTIPKLPTPQLPTPQPDGLNSQFPTANSQSRATSLGIGSWALGQFGSCGVGSWEFARWNRPCFIVAGNEGG